MPSNPATAQAPLSAVEASASDDEFLAWLRHSVVGFDAVIRTPNGPLPKRYFDYTASGLPFRPIEDLVRDQVLPFMANTHTEASATGGYMTRLYEDAHAGAKRHVGAGDDDVVIFTGSGATGAINKLVRCIGILVPEPLDRVLHIRQQLKAEDRPLVVISRMEHHSNDLPWRESVADVVMVGFDERGRISPVELDAILSDPRHAKRPLKIGSFCAASNVTGIINDCDALARVMHKHGGYACFDFAAAAPYLPIDMRSDDPATRKYAVFISVHKYLGGPQAPGLLVANRRLFRSRVPVEPGGGTVVYTSPWDWKYTSDLTSREEGGTPDIVGVIRAHLAFQLKELIGEDRLRRIEETWVQRAIARWSQHPRLHILGDLQANRIGIVSLVIDGGKLHHNLAARMLSDRFGIQTRGGCMCAGSYGHELLGISEARSFEIRCALDQGDEGSKPGWLRISFSPATAEDDFAILLAAVEELADSWEIWKVDYEMNDATATWKHTRDREEHRNLRLLAPVASHG